MVTYVALLRGINVGGKNIIKMAELKQLFQGMGLSSVKTYIQSGNVLFKSDEDAEVLGKKIEDSIEKAFGFPVPVILRTDKELEDIVINCPFSKEQILSAQSTCEGESFYVSLMLKSPLQENLQVLDKYKSENEEYVIKGKEVFLLFRYSIRKSKVASNLHRLAVPSTVRNWKTINKLVTIAKEMN